MRYIHICILAPEVPPRLVLVPNVKLVTLPVIPSSLYLLQCWSCTVVLFPYSFVCTLGACVHSLVIVTRPEAPVCAPEDWAPYLEFECTYCTVRVWLVLAPKTVPARFSGTCWPHCGCVYIFTERFQALILVWEIPDVPTYAVQYYS